MARKASLKQINHIQNLHISLRRMFSYKEISNLSDQEASSLIRKLRAKSNERLTKQYKKVYGVNPDPSELWRVE